MNKSAIQRFAMKARTDLIEQVSQRAYQYGITKDSCGDANAMTVGGRALSTDEQRQRRELVEQIGRKGYTQVMEEVAYTWFNRFIALRFMEVNNYLPSHIRVFSDSTGAFKPEILNDVLHLDLPGLDTEKVASYIQSNQTEDLYRYLLLTQCNALNEALPQMFEKMGGYTELLLPNNILKQDSVLGHMVTDIEEADWTDQVQIIGWLYQYYNSELKDDTFALLKKNVKITKERIPSATQLFTPDWIVRYMVENSLGRIFIDKRKDEGIYGDGRGLDELSWKEFEAKRIANEQQIAEQLDWKYYLPEAEQTQEVRKQLDEIQSEAGTLDVKSIKVIDPCMGSGHILVYAFDVLVKIYKEYGISERDAAQSILENNLFGLDIDDRAAQLAYFAVMMKARQYDRRIFSRGIQPHVHSIMETNALGGSYKLAMGDFLLSKEHQDTLNYLLDAFLDAKEYGSILQLEDRDYNGLMEAWKYTASQTAENVNMTLWYSAVEHEIPKIIDQAIILTQEYDVVVTNPPYMAVSNASTKVQDLIKEDFPDSKTDMFAVFIERCGMMAKAAGYYAMITQQVWMYIASYEKLRNKLLSVNILNMLHLGARAFDEIAGEVVQTAAFVMSCNQIAQYKGTYCRLLDEDSERKKELAFLGGDNRFITCQSVFAQIPRAEYIYWISESLLNAFMKYKKVRDYFTVRNGLTTGDNNLFLRLWYEVPSKSINKKWFPCNKGGTFRRWYGNKEYMIDWENDGYALKHFTDPKTGRLRATLRNIDFNFKPCVVVGHVASGDLPFRYVETGFISESAVNSIFPLGEHMSILYLLATLNSKPCNYISSMLSPTLGVSPEDVLNIPIPESNAKEVSVLAEKNIEISRHDWDSFETSWDFSTHPLVQMREGLDDSVSVAAAMQQFYGELPKVSCPLELCYLLWQGVCNDRFNKLKANEEELNRIFIDIYGLQDELTPEVEDKDVTVRKADPGRDIRSLISYAVGCMFGRYSLYNDGLLYAGGSCSDYGSLVENIQDHLHAQGNCMFPENEFYPDEDNIIPICDDDYFDDDITGRFVKWVETVYGSEALEGNLKFIADALGGKGTSREVIRSYFLNDFYSDHLKVYQKRPIYWLFDSGKKNGFKALIYMHRYQSDLLARMRTDYVHEQQERYRTQLAHLADAIDHASASERVKLTKQQKKLQEQSLEIQKYEEKIHHLADQNIQIDLDDGVNHNYELFADVLAKRK